jgi:cytidine deaminase
MTAIDEDLLDAAATARARAYVPYSGFAMGAAVRCTDGTVVPGTLIENVSLGLAMCAERVALFSAVAQGRKPAVLALVAPRTSGVLTQPCGACLQVAMELGGADLPVMVADPEGESSAAALSELLPRAPHRSTFAGS